MRWKVLFGGLALLLAAVGGCKQPVFLTVEDLNQYSTAALPDHLVDDPHAGVEPVLLKSGAPATVLDPDRPLRYLSLAEAIATALEKGSVGNTNEFGNQSSLLTSQLSFGVLGGAAQLNGDPLFDQDIQFTGQGLTGSDAIRVLRLDPATVGAGIELALSRFDAVWSTSTTWNNTDRPVGTPSDIASTGGTVPNLVQQDVTASTGVYKPLPTGGVAGITFAVPYTYTNVRSVPINPSYRPDLQFSFEQPLLQGFGVEINEMRPSLLTPILPVHSGLFNGQPTPEGILITRVRFDQQRADFERNLNFMVLNVEIAYWNLYNAYWSLYSAEQALRQAYEAWKISKAKYESGQIPIGDLAQARGTYEQFRGNRLLTMNTVLDAERSMRGMMGLQMEDCTRLVPTDTPTLAPYQPDWCSSWDECMANLPELALCREEIKANQMNVLVQRNTLLPDLRFTATYDFNALGDRLDGGGTSPENALGQLASDHFNNWAVGLKLNVPIGFRAAQSNLRVAELKLARSYEFLKHTELKAERQLGLQFRRLTTTYELIKVRRAQREAFAEQLKARFQEFLAGRQGATLDRLLEAQKSWADALATEFVAIRDYNCVIVAFEASRGTNLRRNNIIISEGAVPAAAQKRAVEHQRERELAIPLRERAVPNLIPLEQSSAPLEASLGNTPDRIPDLATLWKKDPPLKDAPALPHVDAILAGYNNGPGGTVQNPTPAVQTGNPVVPIIYKPLPTGGIVGGVPVTTPYAVRSSNSEQGSVPAISTSKAPSVYMGAPEKEMTPASGLKPMIETQSTPAVLLEPPPSMAGKTP
jgi:outer membrane protein TolC